MVNLVQHWAILIFESTCHFHAGADTANIGGQRKRMTLLCWKILAFKTMQYMSFQDVYFYHLESNSKGLPPSLVHRRVVN